MDAIRPLIGAVLDPLVIVLTVAIVLAARRWWAVLAAAVAIGAIGFVVTRGNMAGTALPAIGGAIDAALLLGAGWLARRRPLAPPDDRVDGLDRRAGEP
jgi:hypothetical protein